MVARKETQKHLTNAKGTKWIKLAIGFLFLGILAYIAIWSFDIYKFFFYRPSPWKKHKLVEQLKQRLTKDNINAQKIQTISIKYNPKEGDYTYILKIDNEPYTYECYFSYCNNCAQEERKLYCQIQEIAIGKITVVPTLAEDKANDIKAQKEYQQQFNKQYKELIKGLLLEKYLE